MISPLPCVTPEIHVSLRFDRTFQCTYLGSYPKGRAELGVRQWTCCECGTLHDRDLNAANNIATAGAGHRPQ